MNNLKPTITSRYKIPITFFPLQLNTTAFAMPKIIKAHGQYSYRYAVFYPYPDPCAPGFSGTQKTRANAVRDHFLEALGLSTSAADLQKFTRIKGTLRRLIKNHFDFHLTKGAWGLCRTQPGRCFDGFCKLENVKPAFVKCISFCNMNQTKIQDNQRNGIEG
jgi:hypothetical protein